MGMLLKKLGAFILPRLLICYSTEEVSNYFKSFPLTQLSRQFPPSTPGGAPLNVEVNILFYALSSSIPKYYTLELDLTLRWRDHRLVFNSSKDEPIILVGEASETLWSPDLWIEDEIKGKINDKGTKSINVFRDGLIVQKMRLKLDMFCAMNYWVFPFDRQICRITFQPFAYNTQVLRLHWLKEARSIEDVVDFKTYFQAIEYTIISKSISKEVVRYGITGNFDQLIVLMDLVRDVSYFIIQQFIPLNLNVILSMTTFWIDYTCVKARVTIPLVVVMTLTKQTLALKAILPFSNEPTSLEYYLNFSILFVFMVLLEYCIIEVSKAKEIDKEQKEAEQQKLNMVDSCSDVVHDINNNKNKFTINRNIMDTVVHPLDKKARFIFPLVFVTYNAAFFLTLFFNLEYGN